MSLDATDPCANGVQAGILNTSMGAMMRETMICIAGFGDNASMYAPLLQTPLAKEIQLEPLDLPGFGAPRLADRTTTLEAMADDVDAKARKLGARIVLAHSVASIIASLAAQRHGSPIELILSLEGNLTADDAYFSGTAADHDNPQDFRAAFLGRLDAMATDQPIIARYRDMVAHADAQALWELGCDARRYSSAHVPGDVLLASADVVYIFNPANVPAPSLAWLDAHPMATVRLEGASHWPTIDQPQALATEISAAVRRAQASG